MNALPAPHGVYYRVDKDNFYDMDGNGMGEGFWERWKAHASEFPTSAGACLSATAPSAPFIPQGVYYQSSTDCFFEMGTHAPMGTGFWLQWKGHAGQFPSDGELRLSAPAPSAPKLRPEPVCACRPGQCTASADGLDRGRISAISDVRCKATMPAVSAPELYDDAQRDFDMRAAAAVSPGSTDAVAKALSPGKTFELGAGEMFMRAAGPSAPDLLEAAAGHMRDRAATYDKPEGERSMAKTVEVFNALEGTELTEAQGWTLMLILKLVRDNARPTPHRDSVEDSVAYVALRGEARLRRG